MYSKKRRRKRSKLKRVFSEENEERTVLWTLRKEMANTGKS